MEKCLRTREEVRIKFDLIKAYSGKRVFKEKDMAYLMDKLLVWLFDEEEDE